MRCFSIGSLRCAHVSAVAIRMMAAGTRAPAAKRRMSALTPGAKPVQPVQLQSPAGGAVQIGDIVFTYPGALLPARLIKRYKRFLADVEIDGALVGTLGEGGTAEGPVTMVVHCPNTGPMTGLLDRPLAPVYLSTSSNKGRKYAHTLEMVQPDALAPCWVGVHSAKANAIVASLLEKRAIPALGEYASIQAEVKSGPDGKSRVDFLLRRPGGGLVYVEVKSVTLTEDVGPECCGPPAALKGSRRALFPDTVSERAQRHVRDAMAALAAGHEAVLLFCVQRGDCDHSFSACEAKDPAYSALVRQAAAAGVRMVAVRCELRVDAAGAGTVHYLGELPVVT